MTWPRRLRLPLLAVALGLAGCAPSPQCTTIGQAARVILYEGLPHPMYEAEVLDAERKSKPTVLLLEYPFYREPLELTQGDAAKLISVLADSRSFRPHGADSKCGGFHPDYAVQWSVASAPYACLFCFGCSEVMIQGPAGRTHHDITREASQKLRDVLAPLRKSRPPHAYFGPGTPA